MSSTSPSSRGKSSQQSAKSRNVYFVVNEYADETTHTATPSNVFMMVHSSDSEEDMQSNIISGPLEATADELLDQAIARAQAERQLQEAMNTPLPLTDSHRFH